MTQDEIIRITREAGVSIRRYYDETGSTPQELERFAALVVAHEREKQAEQEQFDMEDHPPHRLCECRKCMEYFTPLPDCDAFAASGKPIAEQEPVGYVYDRIIEPFGYRKDVYLTKNVPVGTNLYTAPVEIPNPGSGMFTKTIQERARTEMKEEIAKAIEGYDCDDPAVSGRDVLADFIRRMK